MAIFACIHMLNHMLCLLCTPTGTASIRTFFPAIGPACAPFVPPRKASAVAAGPHGTADGPVPSSAAPGEGLVHSPRKRKRLGMGAIVPVKREQPAGASTWILKGPGTANGAVNPFTRLAAGPGHGGAHPLPGRQPLPLGPSLAAQLRLNPLSRSAEPVSNAHAQGGAHQTLDAARPSDASAWSGGDEELGGRISGDMAGGPMGSTGPQHDGSPFDRGGGVGRTEAASSPQLPGPFSEGTAGDEIWMGGGRSLLSVVSRDDPLAARGLRQPLSALGDILCSQVRKSRVTSAIMMGQ